MPTLFNVYNQYDTMRWTCPGIYLSAGNHSYGRQKQLNRKDVYERLLDAADECEVDGGRKL